MAQFLRCLIAGQAVLVSVAGERDETAIAQLLAQLV